MSPGETDQKRSKDSHPTRAASSMLPQELCERSERADNKLDKSQLNFENLLYKRSRLMVMSICREKSTFSELLLKYTNA